MAGDGGFDLAHCPSIRAWLGRVGEQSGHIPLDWRP
jgi:hypothetical protein